VVRTSIRGITIVTIRLRDVHLAADDWLHTGFVRCLIETNGAEQIPVICHRYRGHFVFGGCLGECVVIAGAVEQTEPRMEMQMDETGRHAYSHSIVAGGLDVMS
jgi:hypothetical protein